MDFKINDKEEQLSAKGESGSNPDGSAFTRHMDGRFFFFVKVFCLI